MSMYVSLKCLSNIKSYNVKWELAPLVVKMERLPPGLFESDVKIPLAKSAQELASFACIQATENLGLLARRSCNQSQASV